MYNRVARLLTGRLATGCRRAFHGRPLLVVVPRFNHKKWKRVRAVVVIAINAKGLVKGLPARSLNVTIQTPLGGRIVKAWPGPTDSDLIGMLVLHGAVEIFEIRLAPVAAVQRPTLRAGLNPGIGSCKITGKLSGRFIFINKQRRAIPTAAVLANFVPVNVTTLGENKEQRLSVIGEIGIAIPGGRSDVGGVGLIQSRDSVVGGLRILIFGLVIEEGNLKMIFAGCLLQKTEVVIGVGTTFAVPVDDKGGDTHSPSFLNLLAQDTGVLAGVTDIHVGMVAEPGHIDGKEFRREGRSQSVLHKTAMDARGGASARHHKKG